MTQITWIPGANAATTARGCTATTAYAQLLPLYAPEIQYLPTTTYAAFNAIITNVVGDTTTIGLGAGGTRALHVREWRKHGGRQYVAFDGETTTATKITLTYDAVNEMVRT